MSVTEQSRVRQVPRTASRTIDGRALVVAIDDRRLHTLSPVATRIWELADGRDLGAIADAIVAEFEVDRPVAVADACRFVEELVGLGLVEVTG